jgi:streptomycin 6-kinase
VDVRSRLRACERRWRLETDSRLDGGFRSDVFACTTASGGEVVVKLTVTPGEARAEAAALAAWMHTRAAVQLIDVDFDDSALLLERLRPGTPLPGGDDPAAVEIAADLLMRLHRATAGPFPFPALEEIYPQLEDRAREDADYEQRTRGDPRRGEGGLARLGVAKAAAMRLCATTEQAVLLHGDFLDKNLLCTETGYVAVDPIPRLGDPCADIGFFAADHPPAATILQRAAAIAERMSLDEHRARRWAAIWTVLQTSQAWREDQQALEASLASDEFESLLRQ